MSIRADILRRHWGVIVLVTLLSGVIAFGASFLWSPRYLGVNHVLVRVREARILSATGEDLSKQPTVIDTSIAKSVAQTHSNLLTSRDLAERVVKDLNLDQRQQDQTFFAQLRRFFKDAYRTGVDLIRYGYHAEPTPYEGAVVNVQTSLEGRPVKDSYVVQIRASADDPQLAAAIADSASKNLIAMSAERAQHDSDRHAQFLKDQVARLQAQVRAAETAVQQYKEQQGITDVGEAIRLDVQAEQTLRASARDTEADLAAATAERETLEAELRRVAPTESTSSTIETGRSTTTTTSTTPNRVYQDLKSRISEVTARIASLEARRSALMALLTPLQAQPLPAREARLRELELNLSIANDAFRNVRSDYEAALKNSEQGVAEITQVDKAGVPLYPESPQRYLFLVVGLLLGALGGTGLAYYLDRRPLRPVLARAVVPGHPQSASASPAQQ